MSRLLSLFTTFSGRITRREFWLGLVLITLISPISLPFIPTDNPLGEVVSSIQQLGLKGLLWSVALLTLLAMLMVKRLHDRDKGGWRIFLFYTPAAVELAHFFSVAQPYLEQVDRYGPLLLGLVTATGIWFIIELGFYPGTAGRNRFGPDPRGSSDLAI